MLDSLQLKKICWVWLGCFWSAGAAAAQATFGSDLSTIPPAAVAVAVVLALIGGAAATLRKIASPTITIKSVPLEVTSDLLLSLLAGLVTYFLCAWQEVPILLQAGLIPLAGFGGARVLEAYLAAGLAKLSRFGGPPSPPPEGLP